MSTNQPSPVQENPFLQNVPLSPEVPNFDVYDQVDYGEEYGLPTSSPNALGRGAVKYASYVALESVNDDISERSQNQLEFYLDASRQYLDEVSDESKIKYGKKLLSGGVPDWLREQFGGNNIKPRELIDAITQVNSDGSPTVSDETLTNLFQWHIHVEGQKQLAFEKETIAPMRLRFAERLHKAVADGWVSEEAVSSERLERIATTPVLIDDELGGDVKFGPGGVSAYALGRSRDGLIVLGYPEANQKSLAKIEHIFTHEMVHMITGYSPDPVDKYDYLTGRFIKLKGTYGMERLYETENMFDADRGRDLNEAVTEHFAQALISGNVEKIRPMKGAYRVQRYLLRALCERGNRPISPQLFVRAMMADRPHNEDSVRYKADGQAKEVNQLQAAMDQAFPGKNIPELYYQMTENAFSFGTLAVIGARKAAKDLL